MNRAKGSSFPVVVLSAALSAARVWAQLYSRLVANGASFGLILETMRPLIDWRAAENRDFRHKSLAVGCVCQGSTNLSYL